MIDCQTVIAIGKPCDVQVPLAVCVKIGGILVGLAEEMNRCRNGVTGGIGYVEAQFPAVALRKNWESAGEKENEISLQRTASRNRSVFVRKTLSVSAKEYVLEM